MHAGYMKVIPLNAAGALGEPFNVRLEDPRIADIAFLSGCPRPTVVVLYEDTRAARHVKVPSSFSLALY